MRLKAAYFQLVLKDDGTYLQLIPSPNGGKAVTFDEIHQYFHAIKLEEYDRMAVMKLLQLPNQTGIVRIKQEPITPVDGFLTISINKEELEAVGRFYPPSTKGRALTKDKIYSILTLNGVKAGIDESEIDTFLIENLYNMDLCVAKGMCPIQGTNGRILYQFKTSTTAQPKINEDGTVDYHHLDLIRHVEKGDLLATMVRGVPGKNGLLVTGKVISPGKIKDPRFKHGKNIRISEDGNSMYAETAGHVYVIDDKVFVSNIYEVLGNVDASTGDIEYNGDIHVKGNVSSGFSIKATGQIIVDGVVEGSNLEAEGPIIIKGGIQGMNKGNVVSKMSVTAKFIENGRVDCAGDVYADAIMHSKVSAKHSVIAKGKKGLIIGGEIHAGDSVMFKVAGSPMGAFTQIEVGVDPSTLKNYRMCEVNIKKNEKERESLSQVALAFKQKLGKGLKLNQNQVEAIKTIAGRLKELEHTTKELKQLRDEYGEELISCQEGQIIVEDKVYPGVKLVISNAILIVKTETHYCRFEKNGEDIISKPM